MSGLLRDLCKVEGSARWRLLWKRIPCVFVTLPIKYSPETSIFNIHSLCHFMNIEVRLSYLSAVPVLNVTMVLISP